MESSQWSRNLSTAVSETTTDISLPQSLCWNYEHYCALYHERRLERFSSHRSNFCKHFGFRCSTPQYLVYTLVRVPSKLLLCSLNLTDLGVGLVVQPQFVTFLITKVGKYPAISCFCIHGFAFAGSMLPSVSLLTMAAICLDRYIALFFHLEYNTIVTSNAFVWSLHHLVVIGTRHSALAIFFYFLFFSWCFRLYPGHFCGLYKDLPRVTSSTWIWGTGPSTSPSWTTGRKHTGRCKVQEISIQHVVDLLSLYTQSVTCLSFVCPYSHYLFSTISWLSASLNSP